jgi:PAS domain S-box-containing protein
VPSLRRALREAAERSERKRAEAELRESEYRYRTLFDSIDEGFCTIEVLFDEDDKPVDYSFLQINPSFERQTGIQNVIGRRMREIAPRHEAHWFEIYGTIALTGEPMRFENEAKELGRWYDVYAFRVDDPKLRRVGILFKDITERKRAEEELRQAQAAQFEIRLETQLRERTRIARELHDTLLQTFNGLLLRFQSVLKMLPERPVEATQRLESALEQAAEAITDARDTIQGLRSLAAEIGDLGRAITAVGEELTAHQTDFNPPAIDVEVKGAPRHLKPTVRDEAYRIASEAVRNAFQHARARRVAVEIRYDETQFYLRVRDDGKGLDEEAVRRAAVAGHFGLHGMRERAEIVGGRLEVRSELDSGTEVELSIPGAIAYGTPVDESWFSKVLSGKSRMRARSHE